MKCRLVEFAARSAKYERLKRYGICKMELRMVDGDETRGRCDVPGTWIWNVNVGVCNETEIHNQRTRLNAR